MAASEATSSKGGGAVVISDACRWRGISAKGFKRGGADAV
jgi:hypothetical protein